MWLLKLLLAFYFVFIKVIISMQKIFEEIFGNYITVILPSFKLNKMNIAQALKEARKKSKLNQMQFGKKYKLSQTYISLIENGRKVPSVEVIQKYQKAAKIPISVLLFAALEEKDIQKDKQSLFRQVKPIMDDLIKQVF